MARMPDCVGISDCVEFADPVAVMGLTGKFIRLAAAGRTLLIGEVPSALMVAFLVPAACLSFTLGIALAMVHLPRGFDLGMFVLSRLCSSYHNPTGHGFLTFGMIALPAFLAPAPAWLSRRLGGCPRLSAWGRATMGLGLVATAGVGIERAWCPTHWTPLESLHLILAGVAFGGLWLGMAMLAGAADAGDGPRVRWRWLLRPPWYLSTSILPITILFGSYLPVLMVPRMHAGVMAAWPRWLGFLRSVGFWQAYLVAGLLVSLIAITVQAGRGRGDVAPHGEASPDRTSLSTRPDGARGARIYADARHQQPRGPRRWVRVGSTKVAG